MPIARKSVMREDLDDRSLLQFARSGDVASARALVNRYAGGLHAFVHARVGSTLAVENTAVIFESAILALKRDSFIDGSMARLLHEQAIARIILDGQDVHDPRLARMADVLAAESMVSAPAPEPVVSTAVAAVLEASAQLAESVIDGPIEPVRAPQFEPPSPEVMSRQPPPVPPLPVPEVPASPDRALRLIVALVIAAVIAVVVALVLYGDLNGLNPFEAQATLAAAIVSWRGVPRLPSSTRAPAERWST